MRRRRQADPPKVGNESESLVADAAAAAAIVDERLGAAAATTLLRDIARLGLSGLVRTDRPPCAPARQGAVLLVKQVNPPVRMRGRPMLSTLTARVAQEFAAALDRYV